MRTVDAHFRRVAHSRALPPFQDSPRIYKGTWHKEAEGDASPPPIACVSPDRILYLNTQDILKYQSIVPALL